jgi:hypothetical protein
MSEAAPAAVLLEALIEGELVAAGGINTSQSQPALDTPLDTLLAGCG